MNARSIGVAILACTSAALLLVAGYTAAAAGPPTPHKPKPAAALPNSTGSSAPSGSEKAAAGKPSVGLTVSPRRALFDTHFWPGEAEVATATLTNTSTVDISVSLTANLVAWVGHNRAPDALMVATRRTEHCSLQSMQNAPMTPMAALTDIDHGTINAGSTVALCMKVELPSTAVLSSPATSVIQLQFATIDQPRELEGTGVVPSVGGALAFTGARQIAALILLALGLSFAGIVIGLARREQRRLRHTDDAHTNAELETVDHL